MNVPMVYEHTDIPEGLIIQEWRAQQPKRCSFCQKVAGQLHAMFCIHGGPMRPVVR